MKLGLSVNGRAWMWVTWLGVLLLAALVYLPGLPGEFMFDDIGSIANNPSLRLTDLSLSSILHAVLSAPVGGLLRPLSTLSFMLDAHFFGLSPAAFKLTNIGIHLSAGAVLWCMCRELLRCHTLATGRHTEARPIDWLSLAAVTLWLVHPLNLTSVLYSVQRDNSLAAVFSAASMWCYLVARRKQIEGGKPWFLLWLATPGFIVLGMLCKENAALVPVYLLVIEITLLGFRTRHSHVSREIQLFYAVFLLAPFCALCLLTALRPAFLFAGYANRDFDAYQRLLTECRVLLDYLRWTLFPDLKQLGLFHDDILPSRTLLDPVSTLPSVLGIASLLVSAIALRRKLPFLSFGILWFFAGQLMESTLLPLELVFEHRNYLPIFGLLAGIVLTLYGTVGEKGSSRLVMALLGIWILALALATTMRALDWHSELSFARSESQHHPGSARANSELQWAYMIYIIASKDVSVVPEAVRAAERSKALDPDSINQDIGLAYMFAALGDNHGAKLYLASADQRSQSARPTATLQLALQSLLTIAESGDQALYPDMESIYRHAISNPKLMASPCYYAGILNTYALFADMSRDIPAALAGMHKAVTLCPGDPLMHWNFARMLLKYGDTRHALPEIDAIRDLHSIRYLPELQELEREYAQQAGTQVQPKPGTP